MEKAKHTGNINVDELVAQYFSPNNASDLIIWNANGNTDMDWKKSAPIYSSSTAIYNLRQDMKAYYCTMEGAGKSINNIRKEPLDRQEFCKPWNLILLLKLATNSPLMSTGGAGLVSSTPVVWYKDSPLLLPPHPHKLPSASL